MPARNAMRDAQAMGLRARGWTYQRIANELGYSNESGARHAVERAMASAVRETTEEAKTLLLADYDAAKKEVWAVLEASHVTISQGRVVTLDEVPVPDDSPVLAAVDRLVKINQEIAKIYGVYAPTRSEVKTVDAIDARLTELAAEMAELGS